MGHYIEKNELNCGGEACNDDTVNAMGVVLYMWKWFRLKT